MIRQLLALLACFTASSASFATPTVAVDRAAQSVTADMQALPVHTAGRVRIEPLAAPFPRGAKAYRFEWPGLYFEGAFSGDRLVLGFDDADHEYRLTIDDLAPVTIDRPGRAHVRIGALAQGPHRLRLEVVNEHAGAVGSFLGFYVPKDAKPGRVPAKARQIEFIGDSSMSGYGNRSPSRQCTQTEVLHWTDTHQAYTALAAKHFDADYQINAISGRGLIRNYDGLVPELVLPNHYPFTLLDRRERWADPAWRPELIVIKLTADFVGALKPGEKWASMDALGADYAEGYGAFIAQLRRIAPDAAFAIWWFDEARIGDLNQVIQIGRWRKMIAERAKAAGVSRIEFLPMRDLGFDMGACDSHYSLADHRKTADWLIGWIEQRPELWRVGNR